MAPAIIGTESLVNVSASQARGWFLSLKDYPERYRFGTHEGFVFVRGDFGEVGSRFKTREKFPLLKLELLFELIEVDETSFCFRLIRPAGLGIWGAFAVEELSPESVLLRISNRFLPADSVSSWICERFRRKMLNGMTFCSSPRRRDASW